MDSDISQMLKKLTYRDYEYNKQVLAGMQEKLSTVLEGAFKEGSFAENLYKQKKDEDWFLAQCQSANNQINKILDAHSKFHKSYDCYLEKSDWLLFSQELISDIYQLNQMVGRRLQLDGGRDRAENLSSNQFFLHAKFAYFSNKQIPETTGRNFLFSSMPTLIRQAIEIKVTRMIGLESVTKKGGGFMTMPISKILDFFNAPEHQNFLSMPLPIATLTAINRWTNTFVHQGIVPFCWQSLEAIDLIEPLFSIKDEETGSLHIHGFSYIAEGTSLDKLKEVLDEKLNANFTLHKRSIEGGHKL
ncbi:MAG: hypothetical protein PHI11_13350 [Gallionella sp.]|nr:hypothetical protein [Gallionella sp.]